MPLHHRVVMVLSLTKNDVHFFFIPGFAKNRPCSFCVGAFLCGLKHLACICRRRGASGRCSFPSCLGREWCRSGYFLCVRLCFMRAPPGEEKGAQDKPRCQRSLGWSASGARIWGVKVKSGLIFKKRLPSRRFVRKVRIRCRGRMALPAVKEVCR